MIRYSKVLYSSLSFSKMACLSIIAVIRFVIVPISSPKASLFACMTSFSVGMTFSAFLCTHSIVVELSVCSTMISLSVEKNMSPSLSLPLVASQVESHVFKIIPVVLYWYQKSISSSCTTFLFLILLWQVMGARNMAMSSTFLSTQYL